MAKANGLTPYRWYQEPRWSRATMVAVYDVEMAMQWWTVEDKRKD